MGRPVLDRLRKQEGTPMAGILAVASLDPFDSVAQDPVSFSFAFGSNEAEVPAGAWATCGDLVARWFNDSGGTSVAFNPVHYLSPSLIKTGTAPLQVQLYDITHHLDGSPHGSPVFTNHYPITPAFLDPGGPLPEGAAIVLSYRADWGTAAEEGPSGPIPTPHRAQVEGAPPTHTGRTRPRARYRGRLFFGPLNSAACDVSSATHRISAGAVAALDLCKQSHEILEPGWFTTAGVETTHWQWCVWSRRNALLNPVTHVSVNSRLGYQRRREDPGFVVAGI